MDDWRDRLKATYRTGPTSLADAFFKPCLSACVRYRRAAGYFSSSALVAWAQSLQRAEARDVSIELLISPQLSEDDRLAFLRATSAEEREAVLLRSGETLIDAVLAMPADQGHRSDFLVWLIANGQLKIQFALPKHLSDPGIFHQKSGVFEFADGARVAFEGSPNETASGYERNYEGLQVFRSWVAGDVERLSLVEEYLEVLWTHQDEQLLVVPLSTRTLELIRERAEKIKGTKAPDHAVVDHRWEHQQRAADAFLAHRRGVLQMATGTGKTRTSLLIAQRLFSQGAVDSVIVCTEGNDLLDQWCAELLSWRAELGLSFPLYKHFGSNHQGMRYTLRPKGGVLVVSREQLGKFLPSLSAEQASRTLVIHDEVHGLGAPSSRTSLRGKHAPIGYVLGLSATPDREYDDEGTAFIGSEIGPVIFEFGLEDAIRKGILVEFDYVPLPYELSDDDRARLRAVYSRQAARQRDGQAMSQEEVWTELSKVYKTAEFKPAVFSHYLGSNASCLNGCILFVEERAYGERILPLLHNAGVRYRTYYADDEREHLRLFGMGEIDCVLTCHKISQGIDIRSLKTVVIFSSARARLETVQRIGRCLRGDPDDPEKRALVVDFVLIQQEGDTRASADTLRAEWLEGLSKIKREAIDAD
jgi:superfamily II DNA or RNA helicase